MDTYSQSIAVFFVSWTSASASASTGLAVLFDALDFFFYFGLLLLHVLLNSCAVNFHLVLPCALSEHNNVIFLKANCLKMFQFKLLPVAIESGTVRGPQVYQHYVEIVAEVNAGMDLTDTWIVQFEVVAVVLSKQKISLLFQKELVNWLIIANHSQCHCRPHLLVSFNALIVDPLVPVSSFQNLLANLHQDLSQCVAALAVHNAPKLFVLSSLFVGIDKSSRIRGCQFASQFFIPFEFVPHQLFHHFLLFGIPVWRIGDVHGQFLELFVGVYFAESLANGDIIGSCCLVCNANIGEDVIIESHPGGMVVVEELIMTIEVGDCCAVGLRL